MAQGCSFSLILFLVFINDLLKEVEKAGLGIAAYGGWENWRYVVCRLFCRCMWATHNCCNKWRLKAKSALLVFAKEAV